MGNFGVKLVDWKLWVNFAETFSTVLFWPQPLIFPMMNIDLSVPVNCYQANQHYQLNPSLPTLPSADSTHFYLYSSIPKYQEPNEWANLLQSSFSN